MCSSDHKRQPRHEQRQRTQEWGPDTAREGEKKRERGERERERKSGRGGREKTQRERKEKRVKDERGREKRIVEYQRSHGFTVLWAGGVNLGNGPGKPSGVPGFNCPLGRQLHTLAPLSPTHTHTRCVISRTL